MRTSLLVAALSASAASCGVETDDRVPTAEYVVPAILRPQCGTAACHSSATARAGYVLDTIEGACAASDNNPLAPYTTEDAETRMPLDSPLPDADILLLFCWSFEDCEGERLVLRVPPLGCPP
jgi:hypothetical protein